jgi:Nucleotide modification associated domain 2
MYVVDRDFGFAPNPFHGICTLATCKPRIRRVAKESDWVIGMGGARLKATGQCIFAMKVSRSITFDEYWTNSSYQDKRPVRNGSLKMIVGDNIYHKSHGEWQQLDSHHSHPDGSPNIHNITNDTRSDAVLVSDHFFYFGSAAVEIPTPILQSLGYKNQRSHRTFESAAAQPLISFIETNYTLNRVLADPFDFEAASSRYSAKDNKVTAPG